MDPISLSTTVKMVIFARGYPNRERARKIKLYFRNESDSFTLPSPRIADALIE